MVVLCNSQKQAEEALSVTGTWMTEAGLELNHDKSRVVDMNFPGNYFDFPGCRFKLHTRSQQQTGASSSPSALNGDNKWQSQK